MANKDTFTHMLVCNIIVWAVVIPTRMVGHKLCVMTESDCDTSYVFKDMQPAVFIGDPLCPPNHVGESVAAGRWIS